MWLSLPAFIVVWYPICNHHIENLTFLFVSYGLIMRLTHVIFTCSFSHRLMPNLQCEMPITLKQALFDTILSLSSCTLFASCMIRRKIVVLDFFVKLNQNILPYDEGVRNGRMNKFIPLWLASVKSGKEHVHVCKKFLVAIDKGCMHLWGTRKFGHFIERKRWHHWRLLLLHIAVSFNVATFITSMALTLCLASSCTLATYNISNPLVILK
jgi:hypothetical protein